MNELPAGDDSKRQVWRAAIITVSDSRAAGRSGDASGDVIAERLESLPGDVVARAVVADNIVDIRAAVRDGLAIAHLVVLTGGTGLGPRDVTPEALRSLLEYEVPGIAEAMRHEGLRRTPYAMLSRQVVGVVSRRLVVSLPGNPGAVAECLDAILPALPHALSLLQGDTAHHSPSAS